jgi:transposase
MLGRRKAQGSLFEAEVWPHPVAPDSIYGRMASVRDVLFQDDDLSEMYCLDNGRPSLPPSLLSGVLLLQYHDDVGDEEAVERLRYDLRWKVALGLPLDYPAFDPTSLVVFRKRLLKHGKERYAFERFLKVAREAGFLPERVRQLIDSSPMKGAGATQDTYTLLRKGIRRLLKALGFAVPERRRGLQADLGRYLDRDKKAEIDWADPRARATELGRLVRDADVVLELASRHADDDEVRLIGWMLTKILGDDVVLGDDGEPKLGEGVARDRLISWTDPEMRHGRKSASSRWNGDKLHLAEEPDSELITEVEVSEASAGDGKSLIPLVASVEGHLGVKVERVLGDTAYGEAENRVECAKRGIDLVSPLGRPSDPDLDKSAFALDQEKGTLTCPGGQTVGEPRLVKDPQGRLVRQFVFPRAVCAACEYFARCVRPRKTDGEATETERRGIGRTVTLHYHESVLREARARQATPAFREAYRERAKVERKLAELMGHGLRQARYVGRPKKRLQALWTAAIVNLKRLFKLAKGDLGRLVEALANVSSGARLPSPTSGRA